jgi:hypothetical protein
LAEGFVYAVVPELLVAVDASGVDLEQDRHAVTSSPGDLGCGDSCVETERDAAVTQVIGACG